MGLLACNDPVVTKDDIGQTLIDTSAKKPEPIPKKVKEDTVRSVFGCYYKMDDKYSDTQDTAEVNKWWRGRLTGFEEKGIRSNLFTDNGGGPNCAEWNPATDLFFAVAYNQRIQDEKIVLEINKKSIKNIPFSFRPVRWGTLIWFELPRALWEKHQRAIKTADLQELYKGENLDTLKKYSPAPLETGQVVEITVRVKNNGKDAMVFTDLFHTAYGE